MRKTSYSEVVVGLSGFIAAVIAVYFFNKYESLSHPTVQVAAGIFLVEVGLFGTLGNIPWIKRLTGLLTVALSLVLLIPAIKELYAM